MAGENRSYPGGNCCRQRGLSTLPAGGAGEASGEVAEEADPCVGCPRQCPGLPDGAEAQHASGWAAGGRRWAVAGPPSALTAAASWRFCVRGYVLILINQMRGSSWRRGSSVDDSVAARDAPEHRRSGFVQDTCLCLAGHKHVYLITQIMPSKGGKRIDGTDFMAYSLT